jgi:hypothetical protein
MAFIMFFIWWLIIQVLWAIGVVPYAKSKHTVIMVVAYLAASISLPFVAFGWWCSPCILLTMAAWYFINMDVWVNLGTYDQPDIVNASKVTRIKYKNIICITIIVSLNILVVSIKLYTWIKNNQINF